MHAYEFKEMAITPSLVKALQVANHEAIVSLK
jgi:hypothetical protein